MELEDVLSDKEPPKPEPVANESDQDNIRAKHLAKEYEAQGRDPQTGQFLKKEPEPKVEAKPEPKVETKPEPKAREEFTEKERAFLRAAEEERRKRQDLERQLAEYRAPKEKTEEKKSFWDDPEGHLKSFESSLEQKLTQREINTKLQTSEVIARSRYKDFDEKVTIFSELMRETPALHAQMVAASDPAEFVYRTAARTKMIQEAGSIDELRAKIEKETREKLEAEYKAKEKDLEKQRAALTGSLSEVKGAAPQQRTVYSGPTPLGDILKGK